jgi:hypothetical protein
MSTRSGTPTNRRANLSCRAQDYFSCPLGYQKNALRTACIDLDECEVRCGSGINKTDCNSCDPLTKCHNTIGLNTRCMIDGQSQMCGYSCDSCPQGFTGSGMTGCRDINECKVDSGGCDPAPCINTVHTHSHTTQHTHTHTRVPMPVPV